MYHHIHNAMAYQMLWHLSSYQRTDFFGGGRIYIYIHNLRNNRYLVTGLGGGSGGFEEASGKGQDTPQ